MKFSNGLEKMPADRISSDDQCPSADLWMDGIMAAFWLPALPDQATADVVPSRMRDDGGGRQLFPRPRRQRTTRLRLPRGVNN
jgi:hypothetical protein